MQTKLSEHFTLAELCKTSYITSGGNIPSRVAIENLKRICENWLEDLRYSYNTLYGQRTREGQSPCNSVAELPAHRGDSPCVSPDIPIVITIADGTKRDFDELILEQRGTTYWIHFAVRPKDNRRKILFDCR